MSNRRLQICSALLLAALLLAHGRADGADGDIKMSARLDIPQVMVGQEATYSVIVEGEDIPADATPNVKGLDAEGLELVGRSTSRQVVSGSSFTLVINGKVVKDEKSGREIVRTDFVLRPTRPGTYELGPAEVIIGGKRYVARPVTLKAGAMPSPDEDELSAPSDIYIRAAPSAKTVWNGEILSVAYYLYVNKSTNVDEVDPNPEIPMLNGFMKYDFESPGTLPTSTVTMKNGETYLRAYLGRLILFPTRPGELTIPPLKQKYTKRRVINPHSFFPQYRSVKGEVSSPPVTVRVKPLPQAGKPDNFTGAVGRFVVSAELKEKNVRTGENVTLIVKLNGTGNLEGAEGPTVTLPASVESYPPEKEERSSMEGEKLRHEITYRYILVARREGSIKIGPVEFNYFDPADGRYKVAESGAMTLNVTPGATYLSPPGSPPDRPDKIILGKDIRYIKPDAQSLNGSSPLALSWRWLVALNVFPLVLLAAASLWRRQRDRLSADIAYARRVKAYETAKKRISRARKAGPGSDDYHGCLYRAVAGYIADMFNLPDVGMTDDDFFKLLQDSGISESDMERVRGFLEQCGAARYRPGGPERDTTNRLAQEAEDILRMLRKVLKENQAR